jgi:hypothetical protein
LFRSTLALIYTGPELEKYPELRIETKITGPARSPLKQPIFLATIWWWALAGGYHGLTVLSYPTFVAVLVITAIGKPITPPIEGHAIRFPVDHRQ